MNTLKLTTIAFLVAIAMSPLSLFAYDEVTPTDADIVTDIKSEVILDDEVSDNDVSITSKNGVVTIEGYMDSPAEANELIDVARSTPGVTRVDTPRLKIGPEIVPEY